MLTAKGHMTSKGLSQTWTKFGAWDLHRESTDCLFCVPRSDFQIQAPALTFILRFSNLGIAGPKKEWGPFLPLHHYPVHSHNHLLRQGLRQVAQSFSSATPVCAPRVIATWCPAPWGRLFLSCQGSLGVDGYWNDWLRNYSGLFAGKNESRRWVSQKVFCRTRRVYVEKVFWVIYLECYKWKLIVKLNAF